MRIKVLVTILALAVTTGILSAPTSHAAKAKKPKPPTVLGTDPAGDWGCNVDCRLTDMGNGLGQDLTKASMGMADAKTVNFIIGVGNLPSNGGVPEFSRYTWEFTVNGTPIQMSGGYTEYLRGICNPVYNPLKCPPPRDPGSAPFFLRVGGCLVGGPCEEIGLVHGNFDPAAKTITVPVPLATIKAKPGSKIGPGVTSLGGSIYAAPAAFISNGTVPNDTMAFAKVFTVPKPKK